MIKNISDAVKKVKQKGILYCFKYIWVNLCSKMQGKNVPVTDKRTYKILLLTNCDSDNLGDQVIEACDMALISTVMKNLGVTEMCYIIKSNAMSIVPQKYLSTKNKKHLGNARKKIKDSDIIIFGGAPMFNYLYQSFYEKTATVLEIAEEFNKPVIFSAIGIEHYEEENEKCQRLKKTLNYHCVKQITTRDDYEALQKYCDSKQIVIGKVSDPAVFADRVFKRYICQRKANQKKKIGLFILRANGFVDNRIDFSREDAAKLWIQVMDGLKEKGYDYELLTSGHVGDEAFIDYLIRKYNVPLDKCIFNMNTPEKMIEKISSYDAIVSCRLHPSIIAYALNVPSVGIVWNNKVKGFYNSIGCESRIIDTKNISSHLLIEKIECAITEGVSKDEEYLSTVYNTLFSGISRIILGECDIAAYPYNEILKNMPDYGGTDEKNLEEKLVRKFRRIYNTSNQRFDKIEENKKMIMALKKENKILKECLEKVREKDNE